MLQHDVWVYWRETRRRNRKCIIWMINQSKQRRQWLSLSNVESLRFYTAFVERKNWFFQFGKYTGDFFIFSLTVCIPITISDNLLPWMGLFLQNTFAETIVVSQIWWWKSNTCTAFLNKYLRRCITLSLNLHLSSTQQVFNLSQFEFCRMLIQPREHYEHKIQKLTYFSANVKSIIYLLSTRHWWMLSRR